MATSTIESDRWSRVGSAVRALASLPLVQSGMSLVASSVVTSALGFVFWIVAARQFSSAELGIGSAVITAMILISEFAQLGLKTGLVRYLPAAGPDPIRLVARCYGIAVGFALLGSIVFVVGVPLWAPALDGLRSSPALIALFVLGTGFWVLFLLEDSVLVGLRLAPWVPAENGAFGLLKIALLFPLASWSGDFGVFLAWVIPVFAVVAAVNWLIARRISVHPSLTGKPAPALREVLGYSLTDWTASTARTVVIGVLPLLVLAQLGSSESAYYFLAWTIAYSVYLLSANVGDALLAEASYDEGNVDRHTLHSGLLSLAVSAPVVVVAAVLAPYVLGVFGPEYADGATATVRLLLLAALPNVITRTYLGKLRAERRMTTVVGYEVVLSVGVLLLGVALLDPMGIAGLGAAWLIMLTLAALYAMTVESVWWWLPRLDPELVTGVERRVEGFRRLAMRLPSRRLDRQVRVSLRNRYTSRPSWRRIGSTAHLQTVSVEGSEGRPPLRFELALTGWGNEILARRNRAVAELVDRAGIASLRPLLPYPIDHDRSGEQHVMIESAVSGRTGTELVATQPDQVIDAATSWLAVLYQATGGWVVLDHDRLDRWVSEPLRTLAGAVPPAAQDAAALDGRLRSALAGVPVATGRLHGNLVLDNLLFDRSGNLAGVIDWEWSDVGPVFVDRAALAASSLLVTAATDVGHVIADALDDPPVLLDHRAFAGSRLPSIDPQLLVLLAWLHWIRPALGGDPPGRPTQFWVARNVTPVLAHAAIKSPTAP